MNFSNVCHISTNNGSCLNLDSRDLLKILTPRLNGALFCPAIEN